MIGALLTTVALGHVTDTLEVVAQVGRWILAIALLAVALGLLVRFGPAKHRSKKWISAGTLLVIVSWIAATLIFELFVMDVANFKTATGELAVFLVLIGYVYTSSIIFVSRWPARRATTCESTPATSLRVTKLCRSE